MNNSIDHFDIKMITTDSFFELESDIPFYFNLSCIVVSLQLCENNTHYSYGIRTNWNVKTSKRIIFEYEQIKIYIDFLLKKRNCFHLKNDSFIEFPDKVKDISIEDMMIDLNSFDFYNNYKIITYAER